MAPSEISPARRYEVGRRAEISTGTPGGAGTVPRAVKRTPSNDTAPSCNAPRSTPT